MLKEIKTNDQGIAIILSVVILAAMLGLAVVSSDIAFQITKSGQSISNSEVAFFAAESAIELTIYDIAVNGRGLDLQDLANQQVPGIAGATWSRTVRLATSSPGLCDANKPKPVCTNSAGAVTSSNDLQVTLEDGQSFQMDLNITGASYPGSHLRVRWQGSGSEILLVGEKLHTQNIETSSNVRVPPSGNLDDNEGYKFRLNNSTGSAQNYTVELQGSSNEELPLGLNITAIGVHNGTERRIEVTRPAWIIY